MKPPFQKDYKRKLDLNTLEDWPRKIREEKEEKRVAEKVMEKCLYCSSKNIVKRGTRKKTHESVQLYLCNECGKVFTPQKVKSKKFPLRVIMDGLSYYNMGYSLGESADFIRENYGINVSQQTISNWLAEFEKLCTYARMREHGKKSFTPQQVIQSTTLYHRQVYRFRYHRAKLALLLQDFRHEKFEPLRQFLDAVSTDCPHQLFENSERSSQQEIKFDLSQVRINEKFNFAVRLAQLVLQAVNNNKERHEILQKFMLANDSVTVAVEVPVWLDNEDIEHFKSALGFDIPLSPEKAITGHIDILQLRNGSVHILDYKPDARKERPIEQLTIYALALSRLTGLRLYEFKCAWFDDKNYYEFYPLHIVYKRRMKRLSKDQTRLSGLAESENEGEKYGVEQIHQ